MDTPRLTYSNFMDSNFLFIDDPMFYIYPELLLGWYYGTATCPYILLTLVLVKIIKKKLNINTNKITFFSSSGGGYAAIVASYYFPGSNSLSINPQLVLKNWPYYNEFKQITGNDLSQKDKWLRNDLAQILKNSKSKHMLVVNIKSEHDTKQHLLPILKELNILPKYGITQHDNILVMLYDADGNPNAHTSFETRSIFLGICFLAQKFFNGCDMSRYQFFAIFLNEFWHDFYRFKKSIPPKSLADDIIIKNNQPNDIKLDIRTINNLIISYSESNYNHMAIFDVQPTKSYKVIIKFDDIKMDRLFSYGLYDFTNKRFVDLETTYIQNQIIYSFLSGNHPLCKFIIYSAEMGKTKNTSLTIPELLIISESY